MKALILAAGKGTRLRPISDGVPKQLVPVAGKPVIEYVIEDIKSCGITDIGVVVGDSQSPISRHLGSGEDLGVDLSYIVQEEPEGLADAVACGREFTGDEPFLVYFGDTLISPEATEKIVSGFGEGDAASLGLQRVDEPSRYGIARFEDGELAGMEEKPDEPPSDLAYIGAVVFSSDVFDVIDGQSASDRGELELTDSIDLLIRDGKNVHWEEVDGLWMDVGKPADVIEANRLLLDGRGPGREPGDGIEIGDGSSIEEGAEIREPVVIGDDTTVEAGAEVGPYTSIGDNCRVSGASIGSSVVMNNVEITADIRMERSLIGPGTDIRKKGEDGSNQYVIGRGTTVYH